MSESELICPKCSGKMALGRVEDRSEGKGYETYWVNKKPSDSWRAMLHGALSHRSDDKAALIGTFCCQSCGFLEWYARPEFAKK